MIVSDGVHWTSAMLATQKNELIRTGQLKEFTVFKLDEFICNNVQNRKYAPPSPSPSNEKWSRHRVGCPRVGMAPSVWPPSTHPHARNGRLASYFAHRPGCELQCSGSEWD